MTSDTRIPRAEITGPYGALLKTPPTVTDELAARLLEQLGAPAMVELTAWVALADQFARTNLACVSTTLASSGLGMSISGFSG